MKNFAREEDTVFCGVFDGHGPHGHRVAHRVRDALPEKLCEFYYSFDQRQGEESDEVLVADEEEDGSRGGFSYQRFDSWKAGLLKAFQAVDDDLLSANDIDCAGSGAAAVSIVKQVKISSMQIFFLEREGKTSR